VDGNLMDDYHRNKKIMRGLFLPEYVIFWTVIGDYNLFGKFLEKYQ
jgi:hypothetical protein